MNPHAPTSLNARVAAGCLSIAAIGTLALSFRAEALLPLHLLLLALTGMGLWAFCDEMGLRKPLVRAGLVLHALSAVARLLALTEPASAATAGHWVLTGFGTAGAVLLWSIAFLHRQRDVKLVGAVGALAGIAPVAGLIAGHLALGTGAWFGAGALMAAAEGAPLSDLSAIVRIDQLQAVWSLAAAWLLRSGRIGGAALLARSTDQDTTW